MTSLHQSKHVYFHGNQSLEGYVAYDGSHQHRRPAVIVIHDWSGRNKFACEKADLLADLGYVGFAVDMYGDAQVGETVDEKTSLMQEVARDRLFLRARLQAALDAVVALEQVDETRVAVIGFCFGGLCALDLARSGANINGVVSFHGLLEKPADIDNQLIRAKVLALHGYNDPMVPPLQVNAFCEEMTKAGVDWQMHMYGQTMHGFTNPLAHDLTMGTVYNAAAEHRALQSMKNFLNELFLNHAV